MNGCFFALSVETMIIFLGMVLHDQMVVVEVGFYISGHQRRFIDWAWKFRQIFLRGSNFGSRFLPYVNLLSFRRKSYSGFLRSEKIHRPLPGLNPRTSDPVESMITNRPPESTWSDRQMDHRCGLGVTSLLLTADPGSIPCRVSFLVEVFLRFSLNRETNVRKFGLHSSPIIIWTSYIIRLRTATVSDLSCSTWPSLNK